MRLENEVYVWFFALLHYFYDSQAHFSAHMNCIKLKLLCKKSVKQIYKCVNLLDNICKQ